MIELRLVNPRCSIRVENGQPTMRLLDDASGIVVTLAVDSETAQKMAHAWEQTATGIHVARSLPPNGSDGKGLIPQ